MTPSADTARHLIDRPDLRRSLDRGLAGPVSLIVAPAGSGKTVLLDQWAASRPDVRFARIDIDPADDDPAHLLAKVATAVDLDETERTTLRSFATIGAGSFGIPLLSALLSQLGERAPVVVVIDDLHRLTNPKLLGEIGWLVDHVPSGVHVALASRYDPPLSLSRHRLHSAMVELRAQDLAFDAETTAGVLDRIAEGSASPLTVRTVLERTEGWAAGVQLTALALRGRSEPERFATNFAGSDRLVADYLSEEVLRTLPEERSTLLLRMSAFERMSPELVESVLGVDDAQEVFDELARESMFLIPFDGPGQWFRFHHLFRELLRYRLRSRFPGEERKIKEAAARWHLAHDDPTSAVRCLLTAESWEWAMDLILARGREVYERGQTASVAQWLGTVPDHVRRARPDAELVYGILLGMSGQAAKAEDILRAVPASPGATIGHRIVAQSYLSSRVQFRPDPGRSLQDAYAAARLFDDEADAAIPALLGLTSKPLLRTLTYASGGRSAFYLGDLTAAHEWFARALESEGASYSVYRVHLLGSLALLEAWAGRLHIARRLATEALDLAEEVDIVLHPATADAYLAQSLIAIESGAAAAADGPLTRGIARATANGRWQVVWVGALQRALAAGVPTGADEPHQSAAPPIVADGLQALRLRRLRIDGPRSSAEAAEDPSVTGWSRTRAEQIAGMLAARDTTAARAALAGLAAVDEDLEPRAAIVLLLLKAWLAALESRQGAASGFVDRALSLAEDNDLVTVFVDVGPEVEGLLLTLPSAPTPFRRTVSRALQDAYAEAPRRSGIAEILADPLTERERELLAHLPSRMSNADLAAHWYVSVNTIKTHMAHIYRKLDVPNRDAAVARARELGLL